MLPNGTVAVGYYDLRHNTTDPSTLPTDYFLAISKDGGTRWAETRLSPTSFDDSMAPSSRGYFLGDYQGLANDGTAFKSLFVQANSDVNNRTDVFESTVTP